MTTFWKVRLSTLLWGFLVLYIFTGEITLTGKIFLVQVAGNTLLMKWLIKDTGGQQA